MGRPRKPTALKVLTGTDRADRVNPDEPKPDVKIPDPPSHLNDIAVEEWNYVAPLLEKMGLVSEIERSALGAYCAAYARWVEAEQELAKDGLVIKTQNDNFIQSPYVGIANQAMGHMRKFLIEFGMTPASRTKVSASKPGEKKNPWGDY